MPEWNLLTRGYILKFHPCAAVGMSEWNLLPEGIFRSSIPVAEKGCQSGISCPTEYVWGRDGRKSLYAKMPMFARMESEAGRNIL